MICWICGKANGHDDGSACTVRTTIPDATGVQSPLSESRLTAILDAQPARFRAGTQAGTR